MKRFILLLLLSVFCRLSLTQNVGIGKSDFSYSLSVYNNYPFPINLSGKQLQAVEAAAQGVLDARAVFQNPLRWAEGFTCNFIRPQHIDTGIS